MLIFPLLQSVNTCKIFTKEEQENKIKILKAFQIQCQIATKYNKTTTTKKIYIFTYKKTN